ncbi:TPA: FRG domain-containing protein [Legionella pneumophila]
MKISWEKFKKEMLAVQNESSFLYRGHASQNWRLQTTLFRYVNKHWMFASEYHKILLLVREDSEIKQHVEFAKLSLPDESPFQIGILHSDSDNGRHRNNFKNTFGMMILLRHLGFPTPILDWTKDYRVAAFFALADTPQDEDIAIYQVNNNENTSSPFGLNLYFSEFEFDSSIISRHARQNSVYSLAIEQTHYDTVCPPEKKTGPKLYLDDCEHLLETRNNVKKYTIENSKQNRLAILRELYSEKLSWRQIYGETHILENTVLKDLAIQTLLF